MTVELLSVTGAGIRSEWLRRELGVSVTVVSTPELRARVAGGDRPVGLFATHPEPYLEILREAAPDRAVVLLPTDQHYGPRARALAALPAVRAAFRPHSLALVGPVAYARAVGWGLSDARPATVAPRPIAAGLKSGLRLRRLIRAIRAEVGDRYGLSPIGYTDKFAHAWVDVFGPVPDDASLVAHARTLDLADGRPVEISFRGAEGQFQRRTAVERAARTPGSDCTAPVGHFSGRDDGLDAETYVEMLRTARFALCPPGFVANESFRTNEALVCGSLPVILEVAISQGTRPAPHLDDVVCGPSWGVALRQVRKMDERERRSAVDRAQRALHAANQDLAARLRELLDRP